MQANNVHKRLALPLRVHHLWDAIDRETGGSRGTVDFERLMAIVNSLHKIPKDEINRQLENAIKDGLVVSEVSETQKREEVEIYKLPDPTSFEKGEKDWYCFQCHLGGGGAVVACEDCPRIYHLDCLPEDHKPQKDLFVCPACHIITKKPSAEFVTVKQKTLNTLIEYSIVRIMEWGIPYLNRAEGETWALETKREAKDGWRFKFLVFFDDLDVDKILAKAKMQKYAALEEYRVDCETVAHSIAVYFGVDELKGNNTGSMFMRDVMHDIQEILVCHDCFKVSNEMSHPLWFCLPCTRPHEIVWAKQTGYPFWPAKVMKREGNRIDVRYFGGNHERGMVEEKNIRSWSTSLSELKIGAKRTAAWNEAFAEANNYKAIEADPEKADTLAAAKTKGSGKPPKAKGAPKRSSLPNSSEEVEMKRARKSAPAATLQVTPKTKKAPTLAGSVNGTPGKRKTAKAATVSSRRESENINVSESVMDDEIPEEPLDAEDKEFIKSLDSDEGMDALGLLSDEEANNAGQGDDAVSSSETERKNRNAFAMEKAKTEASERIRTKVEEYLQKIKRRHALELSQVKKKQWCYNCQREAIYHCCWNTAYCSIDCQQHHWSKEHKKSCRRIRRDKGGGPHQHDDF